MLNKHETELILDRFFKECLAFWERTVFDSREAYANAIRDIACTTSNPYEPYNSPKLDIHTRDEYVRYRKMDLRIY